MKNETIAAIATAMTNSGIGIIRISGEQAFEIMDQIFRSKRGNKVLSKVKSHTVHYGLICDGERIIDEVMVLIMRAPHTYTSEDIAEIDCHGGVLVMQRILDTVIKYGASPADPGEFTKRAFLNGRIDLSQAESVMEVIQAKNENALKSSMNQLQGKLLHRIKGIRGEMLHELAFIETAIDDPEHISLVGYGITLLKTMSQILDEVDQLIHTAENGVILKEGIKTVILGKPNAGKSTLLNRLAGKEKAIVTNIAGTTRDILEEQVCLQGITLQILDTAGIHDTDDPVEKIGVDKAITCVGQADLVVYVADASLPLDRNDERIMKMIQEKKTIVLLNKSDLPMQTDMDELKGRMKSRVISVSLKEESGMEEFEEAIRSLFINGEIEYNDEIYITNVRHKHALEEAAENIRMVMESIQAGLPEDFYSIDLMSAYEKLGIIIGESVGEDLINEIFSKFCVGK